MKFLRLIFSEVLKWTYFLISSLPGKVGTLFRMKFNYYLWNKPTNVYVRQNSEFISQRNIKFGINASLGKNTFIAADNGFVEIGDNLQSNNNVNINASGGGLIKIGNNVMIGPNSVIRSANHRFDDPTKPYNKQGYSFGNIIIEDNVWIGANVVILQNVIIGKNSIIGAGSVVTKNIQSNILACGVSASKKKELNLVKSNK